MKLPNFDYERRLWSKGYSLVAGADEVGRGCFAGPVVSACVVFPKDIEDKYSRDTRDTRGTRDTLLINDSKQLRPDQRKAADIWIKENCLYWSVGEIGVRKINNDGIGRATLSAFRRAISSLRENAEARIEFLLTDAFYVPYIRDLPIGDNKSKKDPGIFDGNARQLAIKKGDTKSVSIAAASIIAKVYRDDLMRRLSVNKKYKVYGWERNKGYGTKEHRAAILQHGISKHHREQFVRTYLERAKEET